jgi:HD-GYP domain-containing protein (c-di-GMP phosphodiesterase class II)
MAVIPIDTGGATFDSVGLLTEAIEAKDPYLLGHSDEVSGYVAAVAEKLDLDPHRREQLVLGSLLHDVGKLAIGKPILLKPGPLTRVERAIVERHPLIGACIVGQLQELRLVAPAILHHHERWDGTGYPNGLSGREIPLEARIIAVADSFSAMTADRPYRRRLSVAEARGELRRCAGTQFDPRIVGLFCNGLAEASAA